MTRGSVFEKLGSGEPVDMRSQRYAAAIAQLQRADTVFFCLNHQEPRTERWKAGDAAGRRALHDVGTGRLPDADGLRWRLLHQPPFHRDVMGCKSSGLEFPSQVVAYVRRPSAVHYTPGHMARCDVRDVWQRAEHGSRLACAQLYSRVWVGGTGMGGTVLGSSGQTVRRSWKSRWHGSVTGTRAGVK